MFQLGPYTSSISSPEFFHIWISHINGVGMVYMIPFPGCKNNQNICFWELWVDYKLWEQLHQIKKYLRNPKKAEK